MGPTIYVGILHIEAQVTKLTRSPLTTTGLQYVQWLTPAHAWIKKIEANKMISSLQPVCKTFESLQLSSKFLGSPIIIRSNPSRKTRDLISFTRRSERRRGVNGRIKIKGTVCGILPVDPWAPLIDSESIASQLFAASLFPYLGFLYFITKSKSAPKLTLFGFYFLLAFVGATIPAGIYAKVHYGTSLSNVDWLHGGAESLLTLTNLFIVIGLRQALRKAESEGEITIKSVGKEEKSSV